jgi:uroporphyrinogen-III synthase
MTKQINIVSTKKLLPNQKQLLLDANIQLIEEDFIKTTFSLPSFGGVGGGTYFHQSKRCSKYFTTS